MGSPETGSLETSASPARRSAVLAVLGAIALSGCAASLRHPTPQDERSASERWPGTSVRDLERARTLYVRRCSGCHTLFLPKAYPPDEWPTWVDAMSERSRLTPQEAEEVTRLLVTLARDDSTSAAPAQR